MEGKDLDSEEPVEAVFRWEKADQQVVAARFGDGVAPSGQLKLAKQYDGTFTWNHGCDEKKALQNFLAKSAIPKELGKSLKGLESFKALETEIASMVKARAGEPETVKALGDLETKRKELLGEKGFATAVWNLVLPRIPQFFYFADYSKLPYSVSIKKVLSDKESSVTESEATARALLRLGGAEDEYLLNPDYERRKRELENVANALTDDVLKFWS